MKNEGVLRTGHTHALERLVLNGVELVNALQRISTQRFVYRQPMAEISTIVRRGRASVLLSIRIGCNQKRFGIEPGQFMRMSERSIVLPVTFLRRCLVVAADVGGMLAQHCRQCWKQCGSNIVFHLGTEGRSCA